MHSHLIARNLRILRLWKGLTQEHVACELEISRVMYCAYESGKSLPPADKLQRLARLYSIPVSFIMHANMNDEMCSPFKLIGRDDLLPVVDKFSKLTMVGRLIVLVRLRTLLEIEDSLYK